MQYSQRAPPQALVSRNLERAREGYERGDLEASRAAHIRQAHAANGEQHAGEGGKYVKSLVFGGLDGIITTFAIVAATVGGNQSRELVITLGLANLLADGISMGLGDYLSSKSEKEYVKNEMKREKWELDNNPDGEKEEMIELYEKQGMTTEDATNIVTVMMRYPEVFLDTMMVTELGLMPPDEGDQPWKNGLVTFLAFLVFGFVPLVSYISFPEASTDAFIVAIVLTAVTLCALGATKAQFINQNKLKSALLMLLNGGLAAASAYFVGWGLGEAFNLDRK